MVKISNPRSNTRPNVSNRPSSKVKKLTKTFCEYTENSTIHGFRYLGERNRSAFEKIFWLMIFSISIVASFIGIESQWNKWNTNPVILTFDTKSQDICWIRFPAVTICPMMKFKTSDLNFQESNPSLRMLLTNSSIYDRNMIKKVIALTHICPMGDFFQELRTMNSSLNKDFDIVEALHDLNYTHTININKFERFAPKYEYSKEFTEIITEEGICNTFNLLDGHDIFRKHTVYNKYTNNKLYLTRNYYNPSNFTSNELLYPFHSVVAGNQGGLHIGIRVDRIYDEFLCEPLVEGYKIMIHSSDEYPNIMSHSYINVPHNHKIDLAIIPKVIESTYSIKHINLDQRECYLTGERKLLYFNMYTQNNCEYECLINYTITSCNCTRFFMPRLKNTRICESDEISCYEEAHNDILYSRVSYNSAMNCNCLPSCSSIQYNTEKYITEIGLKNKVKITSRVDNIYHINSSIFESFYINQFNIYFKESQFIAWKRSEIYGWTDFLGNCGGLFGLFMGISLVSFIEIFYFFIIRTLMNFLQN